MQRLTCGSVWGGIRNQDSDLCTAGLTASLWSSSCRGGEGGDIYYLSVCQADQLTRVAIADVVGHGEEVSRVSGWVYEALATRMNEPDGGAVLAQLNETAVDYGLEAMTTATVVAYYRGDHSLRVATAGHPAALVCARGEETWHAVEIGSYDDATANLPLAVLPDTTYAEERRTLGPGDRVLVYTDGLVEAPRADGEPFGMERLLRVLVGHRRAPLADLKNAVIAAVREHVGGPLVHDDVTVMALEIRAG